MTDLERKQSQLIYGLRYEKEALKNENRHLRKALQSIKDLDQPDHVVINKTVEEALSD